MFNSSFLDELSYLVERDNTLFFEKKKREKMLEIYSQVYSKSYKIEYGFGDVYFGLSEVTFFLKKNFDYFEFIEIFNDLEKKFEKKWSYIEIYDKNVKILEMFQKTSIKRNYRGEIISVKEKNKVKNVTKRAINLKNPKFLYFIQNYEITNVKLIVTFSITV